jgi:hypothetical protein
MKYTLFDDAHGQHKLSRVHHLVIIWLELKAKIIAHKPGDRNSRFSNIISCSHLLAGAINNNLFQFINIISKQFLYPERAM